MKTVLRWLKDAFLLVGFSCVVLWCLVLPAVEWAAKPPQGRPTPAVAVHEEEEKKPAPPGRRLVIAQDGPLRGVEVETAQDRREVGVVANGQVYEYHVIGMDAWYRRSRKVE